MAMGVNLLFHLTSLVAKQIGQQFDIEIIESHHHHKNDALTNDLWANKISYFIILSKLSLFAQSRYKL